MWSKYWDIELIEYSLRPLKRLQQLLKKKLRGYATSHSR
jgi:hypothetical protein